MLQRLVSNARHRSTGGGEQVQTEVKALQDERADLKSQLAFLKSLVQGR